MEYFIKKECKNSNPELYLYDINNIESIIQFIFSRIDFEQTNERKDSNNWKNDKGDKQLNDFLSNYTKNHKSIITDKYTGFYISEEICSNCLEKEARNNNIYQPKREFTDFYYISFDCKKYNEEYFNNQGIIGDYYNPNINENENNFSQLNSFKLNIYLLLEQEFTLLKMGFCNICRIISKKQIQKKFLSLPNVLTIILNNNQGNFEINDEINLNKYAYIPANFNYNLIAMLCKYTNNTYITYCLNHRDSNWYYYTSNEKVVHKVKYLDMNAIPYVLVYQKTDSIKFKYNPINRKKEYLFKFQNGIPQITLYFDTDATVKDAKREIQRNNSYIKNPVLLINGEKLKDMEKLSEIPFDIDHKYILIIDPM